MYKTDTPLSPAKYVARIFNYDNDEVFSFHARSYVQLVHNVMTFIKSEYAKNDYVMDNGEYSLVDEFLYDSTAGRVENGAETWDRWFLYYGLWITANVVELSEPEFSI